MTVKTRFVSTAAAGIAGLLLTGGAMAAGTFTTVNAPPAGEKSHTQLLTQIYGGTWTLASNGVDYSNGTLTATRLADAGVVTPTSLTTGVSGTDDAWTGPAATTIVAKAKYAADNSVFGYFNDTGTDTSFHPLFNTALAGSQASVDMPANFRWALQDQSTGKLWTSKALDNGTPTFYGPTASDQLVTYKVTGSSGETIYNEWALFWEDRGPTQNSDRDFNDAVVTIQAAVPTPGAGALLGLGAVGLIRRKRR